jgi:WXG100 family type VII secretion target
MPAGIIKVTPEQLQQVASQLTAGASNIESILAQLQAAVAPLGIEWAGVAQAQYMQHWEQLRQGAAQVHQGLMGNAQITRQAAVAYAETEQGIAASFGR